jgi:hypothetical protein
MYEGVRRRREGFDEGKWLQFESASHNSCSHSSEENISFVKNNCFIGMDKKTRIIIRNASTAPVVLRHYCMATYSDSQTGIKQKWVSLHRHPMRLTLYCSSNYYQHV